MKDYFATLTQDEVLEFAAIINETSTRTFLLLEELLEWARRQNQGEDFHPEPTVLSPIIKDCVELLSNQSLEKNIEIRNEIQESLQVFADGHMLRTIFRNLLSNAIKFTPVSGSIRLSAREKESRLEISVADTGMGMDSKTLRSLFKIGETRSRNGTNGERGTGFGLLLCKDFVEKHGGNLNVESELGRGSVFRFTLPALPPDSAG